MTRRDVDDFLDRSETVLNEPAAPLAACAWCSHPLDDASPSGEFCGERCASDWRAGLDWYPEERCACRTCDPEGYTARNRIWTGRRDYTMAAWVEAIRRAAPAEPAQRYYLGPSPVAEFGTEVHRRMENYLAQSRAVPEIHVDTSAAERALSDAAEVTRYATEHYRRRVVMGVDITTEGSAIAVARYDEEGNLHLNTELSGWTDMGYVDTEPAITWTNAYDEPGGLRDLSRDLPPAPLLPSARLGAEPTMTIYDEIHTWIDWQGWLPAETWAAAVEPERVPSWTGRKPNRRRRKRR